MPRSRLCSGPGFRVCASARAPPGSQNGPRAKSLNFAGGIPSKAVRPRSLTAPSGKKIPVPIESDHEMNGTVDLSQALAGEPSKGTWTLTVVDSMHRDLGSLKGWNLSLNQPSTSGGSASDSGSSSFHPGEGGSTSTGQTTTSTGSSVNPSDPPLLQALEKVPAFGKLPAAERRELGVIASGSSRRGRPRTPTSTSSRSTAGRSPSTCRKTASTSRPSSLRFSRWETKSPRSRRRAARS